MKLKTMTVAGDVHGCTIYATDSTLDDISLVNENESQLPSVYFLVDTKSYQALLSVVRYLLRYKIKGSTF